MSLGAVSPERWRVLEPLLDAALDVRPPARAAFIDAQCGDDKSLRAEVLALVAACENADGLLAAPASVAYAPLLAEEPPALPPLLDGRYHIGREIGRGGMASVYLADDPKHGRQVAVKVLHTDVARIIGRDRFVREIEIAARLSHPHILPLHDSGEVPSERAGDPPLLYFVSPFVEGESLRTRLLREPALGIDEILRLGTEIALALDYAHRQGVVHLDIKPGNILLQDAHAVIADFGIARAISSAGHATPEPTPLLGTPSYMSPEQALGASDVDGRSDIYSLGCVLYEMITGKRPFNGSTPTAALERARTPSAPDRVALADKAPRSLVSVIMRAMAPSKYDRYETAGDFARALAAHSTASTSKGWRRRGALVGLSVAAVVLAAGMLLRGKTTLDANRIVVAPFETQSPDLALWREGLVDVISRNLDGAGPLRAVPATTAVRRWSGRADAEAARRLGERTGAGLVLFGGLLPAGDSVRATAVLLDARSGQTIVEIEQRDIPARIDRLADSLTVAVLRELGGSRRIDIARAASSPTTSLPALKAYLQGEQFYRAAAWDSAQSLFERALRLDTSFALAYHRLAAVKRWRDATDVPDTMAYVLMKRTSEYAAALAPRERLLATIDSLSADAFFAWRASLTDLRKSEDEQRIVRKLYATIQEGLESYPDDPELLFLLADARSHYDSDVVLGEVDDRQTLQLYDRVIALDPGFAPAYVTPISLAAYLDGEQSARRHIQGYLSLAATAPPSPIIGLAETLLDSRQAAMIDVQKLVDTLPADRLCQATTLLQHIPDSIEILPRFADAMAARSSTNAPDPNSSCAIRQVVDGLEFRGHMRDARRMVNLQAHWLGPALLYNMAEFGMIPADTIRTAYHKLLSLAPHVKITRLYAWWAEDGDTTAIKTYADSYASNVRKLSAGASADMLRSGAAAGHAYLALARRDTVSALRQFLEMRDTLNECWHETRVQIVHLLIAVGRYRDAAPRLERRWPGTSVCSNGTEDVMWTMDRARVFEKLGRYREAAENYAFVVQAWRTADPELQTYVTEARAGVERLRDKARPLPAAAEPAAGK